MTEIGAVARVVLEDPGSPDERAALRDGVKALVLAGTWLAVPGPSRFGRRRAVTLERTGRPAPPGLAVLHSALQEVAGPSPSVDLRRAAKGLAAKRHRQAVIEAARAELQAAGLAEEHDRRLGPVRRRTWRRTAAGADGVLRAPRRTADDGTPLPAGDGTPATVDLDRAFGDAGLGSAFDSAFDGGFGGDGGGDGGGGGE